VKLAGGSLTEQDYFTRTTSPTSTSSTPISDRGRYAHPRHHRCRRRRQAGMVYLLNTANMAMRTAPIRLFRNSRPHSRATETPAHSRRSRLLQSAIGQICVPLGRERLPASLPVQRHDVQLNAVAAGTMRAPVSNAGMPVASCRSRRTERRTASSGVDPVRRQRQQRHGSGHPPRVRCSELLRRHAYRVVEQPAERGPRQLRQLRQVHISHRRQR